MHRGTEPTTTRVGVVQRVKPNHLFYYLIKPLCSIRPSRDKEHQILKILSDVLTCTVPPLRVEPSLLKNPFPQRDNEPGKFWVPAGRALRQSLPRACVRRSSWRGLRLRSPTTHAPSQAHELQQLRQRSTLHDTTLRHQRQRSDGRQSFVRDRRVMGVRPGMLCILVLRTASPRVVPPTRARGTCAHVDVRLAACCCL